MVEGFRKLFLCIFAGIHTAISDSSQGTKSDFCTPQTGQRQSLGMSVNSVPGGIPLSSSPMSGS